MPISSCPFVRLKNF
jgi:hypothetical protein